MSVIFFTSRSWPSAVLIFCLLGYGQISDASKNCEYYKNGDQIYSIKWCPNICCPDRPRRENSTCCNPPEVDISKPSISIFGYPCWAIYACVICLFTALSILIHYCKRLLLILHSKYFNSTVDPAMAFTISKADLNSNPTNSSIVLEQNPPSYSSSIDPPPSYTSV